MVKRISETFFVWCSMGGQWKHKHTTYDSARNEAERLAKQNPGQEFFVLGALGSARTDPYPQIFTEFEIEIPLPF